MRKAPGSDVPIVVIMGPTATGKTDLAIELCERFNGEIVGADSVQVYRYCNIGAGKPKPNELRGVRHHLIDVADPDEALDAAHFARLADAAITDVARRGRVPVVVGGTGLWLRALVLGLVDLPAVDPALRSSLESQFQERGGEAMYRDLARIDPLSAAKIHPHDQVRLVRALEVYAQTGKPLGTLRKEHALGAPRYPFIGLCLDLPQAMYQAVVTRRIERMVGAGLEAEVRMLLSRFGPNIRALGAVGYRQMLQCVQGELPAHDVVAAMVRATGQYARRQRNWFRGERTVSLRVNPGTARERDVMQRIATHLSSPP